VSLKYKNLQQGEKPKEIWPEEVLKHLSQDQKPGAMVIQNLALQVFSE